MKYWTILLVSGILSCGTTNGYQELNGFDEYVWAFYADAARYGKDVNINDITIKFDKLKERNVGQCTVGLNQHPTVYIDIKFWHEVDEVTRHLLIYHELGHCLLGKAHSKDPENIMYPYLVYFEDFFTNKDYYLGKFFYDEVVDE